MGCRDSHGLSSSPGPQEISVASHVDNPLVSQPGAHPWGPRQIIFKCWWGTMGHNRQDNLANCVHPENPCASQGYPSCACSDANMSHCDCCEAGQPTEARLQVGTKRPSKQGNPPAAWVLGRQMNNHPSVPAISPQRTRRKPMESA